MPNYIEWIDTGAKVIEVTSHAHIKYVSISYDEDFNAHIKLDCKIPETFKFPITAPDSLYDAIFDGVEKIVGIEKDLPIKSWEISGLLVESQQIQSMESVTFSGMARTVKSEYIGRDESAEFEIYWLLNSSDQLGYNEGLVISKNEQEEYRWGSFALDKYDFAGPYSMNNSLLTLRFKEKDFLFGKINKSAFKKGSFIRTKKSGEFKSEEIHQILEYLSYAIGVEYLLIGKTSYNISSSPVSSVFISTMRKGILKEISRPEVPPLPVRLDDNYSFQTDPAQIISEFMEKAESKKGKYDINNVLWYLLQARYQHFKMKIQPLATAFDLLSAKFFKGKKNTAIDSKDFKDLEKGFHKLIDDLSVDPSIISDLKKRATNINNNSANQRNKTIFSELGMILSELEMAALSSRNTAVHGSSGDVDYVKMIKECNAYSALINRLFLKLIGMPKYIDYSVQGRSVNDVEVPLQGAFVISTANSPI